MRKNRKIRPLNDYNFEEIIKTTSILIKIKIDTFL